MQVNDFEDVTESLVQEAARALGDRGARFRRAAAAKAAKLTAAQQAAVERLAGLRLEYVSCPLIYADAFRYASAKEQAANAAVLKAGLVRVLRTYDGAGGYSYLLVRASCAPGP